MASLEYISYQPHVAYIESNEVQWIPNTAAHPIQKLPQLFWRDGTPWAEANHWALDKALQPDIKVITVRTLMAHLRAYAEWLEASQRDWRHFPRRKQDRVLHLYRGDLVRSRDAGHISPSTTTARIRAIIQFYRHCGSYGFVSRETPLWKDKPVVIRYFDSVGFERSLLRLSTDISIPNRPRHGIKLEDGLLPISMKNQRELLQFASEQASPELHLLLVAGFFTGGRLGTLTTLRVTNLESAIPDPRAANMWHIPVGPGTGVATKFDIQGNLLVPEQLLLLLKQFAYSPRRLKREAKADKDNKGWLFLTRDGNPYRPSASTREMVELRRKAIKAGLKFMQNFRFHQTRATFGTWLMTIALEVTSTKAAIEFVRNAMLHKHESTTMRYITFIEHTKAKIEVANAFSEAFLGLPPLDKDDHA